MWNKYKVANIGWYQFIVLKLSSKILSLRFKSISNRVFGLLQKLIYFAHKILRLCFFNNAFYLPWCSDYDSKQFRYFRLVLRCFAILHRIMWVFAWKFDIFSAIIKLCRQISIVIETTELTEKTSGGFQIPWVRRLNFSANKITSKTNPKIQSQTFSFVSHA